MRRWNQADQLLAGVSVFFFISLAIKLWFPDNICAAALFFCSEAALVGGIADWFAVTALFRRPLGFPWHTALIPRKRAQLTAACVKMVQDEFFSKKKLLQRVKKMDLRAVLMRWLDEKHGKEIMSGIILQYAEQALLRVDTEKLAMVAELHIKERIYAFPPATLCEKAAAWFQKNQGEAEVLDFVLARLRTYIEGEEGKCKIASYLEAYGESYAQDFLSSLLSVLAQATNVLNFEEAAELLQAEALKFINAVSEEGHPWRAKLLAQFKQTIDGLATDEDFVERVGLWIQETGVSVSLSPYLRQAAEEILRALRRNAPVETVLPALRTPLANLVVFELERALEILRDNEEIRKVMNAYLYDLTGRTVLQAQAMIGVVVHKVMEELSDDELNRLIYEKVEQDLLWVRMNGSIVGAVIGLALFTLMHMYKTICP